MLIIYLRLTAYEACYSVPTLLAPNTLEQIMEIYKKTIRGNSQQRDINSFHFVCDSSESFSFLPRKINIELRDSAGLQVTQNIKFGLCSVMMSLFLIVLMNFFNWLQTKFAKSFALKSVIILLKWL